MGIEFRIVWIIPTKPFFRIDPIISSRLASNLRYSIVFSSTNYLNIQFKCLEKVFNDINSV